MGVFSYIKSELKILLGIHIIDDSIDTLFNYNYALNERIYQMSVDLSKLVSEVSELRDVQSSVTYLVDGLKNRITELQDTIKNAPNTDADVQAKIDELVSQLDATAKSFPKAVVDNTTSSAPVSPTDTPPVVTDPAGGVVNSGTPVPTTTTSETDNTGSLQAAAVPSVDPAVTAPASTVVNPENPSSTGGTSA